MLRSIAPGFVPKVSKSNMQLIAVGAASLRNTLVVSNRLSCISSLPVHGALHAVRCERGSTREPQMNRNTSPVAVALIQSLGLGHGHASHLCSSILTSVI